MSKTEFDVDMFKLVLFSSDIISENENSNIDYFSDRRLCQYLRTSEMDNNTHTILPWHNNTTYDIIFSLTEVSQYIKQLLEILNYLFPGWYSIHLHSPLSH